jgi:hypothetical protein
MTPVQPAYARGPLGLPDPRSNPARATDRLDPHVIHTRIGEELRSAYLAAGDPVRWRWMHQRAPRATPNLGTPFSLILPAWGGLAAVVADGDERAALRQPTPAISDQAKLGMSFTDLEQT